MSARVRPFSNGCQYLDWQNRNCCRCRRLLLKIAKALGRKG